MIHHDCAVLMLEINESGYKLTPKDISVLQNIVYRLKNNIMLSEKQSYAIQELYRRSHGHEKKLYTRILK